MSFDEVKAQWEERFERRYGFWRGFLDEQGRRYLDCGLFENGFARIRCPECHAEYLLAFSCKTRELCPSCAAKRSVATAALRREEVLGEVGPAQWMLTIPKLLRLYFLFHRELLGGLAQAAWETARELMRAAAVDEALRPAMVAVVQTTGDLGGWHPRVHALVSRGGWTRAGEWVPVPYVDEHAALHRGKRAATNSARAGRSASSGRCSLLAGRGAASFPAPASRNLRKPEGGAAFAGPAIERNAWLS